MADSLPEIVLANHPSQTPPLGDDGPWVVEPFPATRLPLGFDLRTLLMVVCLLAGEFAIWRIWGLAIGATVGLVACLVGAAIVAALAVGLRRKSYLARRQLLDKAFLWLAMAAAAHAVAAGIFGGERLLSPTLTSLRARSTVESRLGLALSPARVTIHGEAISAYLVRTVERGGPADRAGLKADQVILTALDFPSLAQRAEQPDQSIDWVVATTTGSGSLLLTATGINDLDSAPRQTVTIVVPPR